MNECHSCYVESGQHKDDHIVEDTSRNNGGETDYYKIDSQWTTFQDVIENRKMNYAQGNIFKVACTFNIGRHEGTTYVRELNKIIYFAKRELERVKNDSINETK